MTKAEEGILLNMLPDEKILYKTKAGRLSLLGFLPSQTVVATNKRLFVFNPLNIFASYSSYFYDKIASVNMRRGPLGSELVINIANGGSGGGRLIFYKRGMAVSMFSVLSNQIAANRDPDHANRWLAQMLDSRYNVLTRPAHIKPSAGSADALFKFARTELEQQRRLMAFYGAAEEVVADVQQKAPQKTSYGLHLKFRALQKYFSKQQELQIPERVQVNYFSSGKPIQQKLESATQVEESVMLPTQNNMVQKQGVKRRLVPERDLKIFTVRRIRGERKWRSTFNLFNLKINHGDAVSQGQASQRDY